MKIKSVSKYGIKLEDYSDLASYRRACKRASNRAYKKSAKGIITNTKYNKSEKGKETKKSGNEKYLKTVEGKFKRSESQKKFNKTLKSKLRYARYAKTEKGRLNRLFNVNKRRASKLQRTPAWADLEAIKQFYINCPKGYHVDHIVPLQGVNISGLHVLNNLQYLTKSENCKKSNKYDV
tara:strand:- start:734 stop:1270 length:537 start_codon:yes stop_codon:yes gene_type:complete